MPAIIHNYQVGARTIMSRNRLHQSIATAMARAIARAAILAALYIPVWMILLAPLPICAQRLSTRCYNVSDGLAHSRISAIHQDRKGYLWFGSFEGLSRFDGYRFANYGVRDGLGHMIINDIVEDRRGRLWVATNGGGVSRLIDDPQEAALFRQPGAPPATRLRFINFRVSDSSESNRVNAMVFDSADNLWLATDHGVYRAATASGSDLQFKLIAPHAPAIHHGAAFADLRGRFWFGVNDELIRIVQDQVIRYGPESEVGGREIIGVIEDRQGRLLAANDRGVFEFIEQVDVKGRGWWRRLPLVFRPEQFIRTLFIDSTGTLWIGTTNGLIKYRDGKQALYTDLRGLSSNEITALMEDRDGNLWIGSSWGGVCKLSGASIVSFTRIEGLPGQAVWRVVEDRQGRIYASISHGALVEIVGERAAPVPGTQAPPFSGSVPFQDSRGEWWIPTPEGLFRSEGPELQLRRGRNLSRSDGITADKLIGIPVVTEDPFGKLWVLYPGNALFRLDLLAKEGRNGRAVFERVRLNTTLPHQVLLMTSDRAGALWLGSHEMLARFMNGKISILRSYDGLPETNPRAFFQDSRGWLWIGLRYKGVSMTKDPEAETPKFVNYSTQTGLVSDTVWGITEDDAGRIYLGTGKGLDRLDLMTGRVHHFNVGDGLAGDFINDCIKDRNGNIWVAASGGLSKFNPRAERIVDHPPPIYLSRVQVAGEDLPLAETGAQSVPELELPVTRNNLLIEYVALSFRSERRLRYQYKLEGVDGDWSRPTEARSVNYARLAPGSYQFLARAINEEEMVSQEPARFRLRILPPLWQRWWFLTVAAMLTGAVVYALYHYRVTQLIELERVRARIATDLHDDIGSNLSQIAIMSEVARSQIARGDTSATQQLSLIARISRESVDAMSDIVWAINPQRDWLSDLTGRMRRFAGEICPARNIDFHFQASLPDQDLRLGADVRRQTYLIFKECLNNLVRHSACSRANIELCVEANWLIMKLTDNGRGIDPATANGGHGLANMRRRAASLGGDLRIVSVPGRGTTITLNIPYNQMGRIAPPRRRVEAEAENTSAS